MSKFKLAAYQLLTYQLFYAASTLLIYLYCPTNVILRENKLDDDQEFNLDAGGCCSADASENFNPHINVQPFLLFIK